MKDTSNQQSVFGGEAQSLPDGGLHILRSDMNPNEDDLLGGILDLQGIQMNHNYFASHMEHL